MNIADISQAEALLQEYIPNVAGYSGDGMSLDRMWPLLEAAGNPQDQLRAIHIAGTSGKTSTAYYIAAMLASAGKKVGLTVSPHVDSITERVQINGKSLRESEFCRDLGDFVDLIKDLRPTPTYFELMIVFVLWDFVRRGVDYAVLETGMGGLLDGTNVVTRADKVCVITDIGLDHTHILGNTITEIAEQKAGIIHENNHVFTYKQPESVMSKISTQSKAVEAIVHVVKSSQEPQIASSLQFELLPKFQKRNWLLAENIARFVVERDGLELEVGMDPSSVVVPGRMEQIGLEDGTTLTMDGSHNQQKVNAFVESFKIKHPGQQAHVLLALKEGKEYKTVLEELKSIVERLIVTTFNTSQDLPAVSQDPDVITEHAKSLGITAKTIADHDKAYAQLVNSSSNLKLVIGSFYLLSQIRS